ncbi:MAG TPA: hypothetical protein VGE94_01575, partial [Chloroflexota bacterium]
VPRAAKAAPRAAAAEAPSPQVSSTGQSVAANGATATTNGSHAASGAPGTKGGRVLRVVIPRGEDDNACVRMLEQLHVLVEHSERGPDEIRLVLHDRAGGRVELSGADILVRHTPDLESSVRSLVGAGNLEIVTAG